jgi:hypothetical protein
MHMVLVLLVARRRWLPITDACHRHDDDDDDGDGSDGWYQHRHSPMCHGQALFAPHHIPRAHPTRLLGTMHALTGH